MDRRQGDGSPQVSRLQWGAIMTNSFRREAVRCKSEARRFAGKAEEPFLLRLSEAFDELAYREREARPVRSEIV